MGTMDANDDGEDNEGKPLTNKSYVKYMILELSPVSHVDTSALHILDDMQKTYLETKGIRMCFVNPSRVVMEKMVKSGFVNRVGEDLFFVSIQDAIDHCLDEMDSLAKAGRVTQATSKEDYEDDDDDSSNNDDGGSNDNNYSDDDRGIVNETIDDVMDSISVHSA